MIRDTAPLMEHIDAATATIDADDEGQWIVAARSHLDAARRCLEAHQQYADDHAPVEEG